MLSLLILLFTFTPFSPSNTDTSTTKTVIKNVTVFRSQAQVERVANVPLKAGKNIVIFTELSSSIIPNSIQLKGKGEFTLLSLSNRNNFTEEKSNSTIVANLIKERDSLQQKVSTKNAKIKVIDTNITLLNSSNNIANNHKLSAAELDALLDLNSKRMLEFEELKIKNRSEINDLNNQIRLLNNQIRESGASITNRYKEIVAEIEVSSNKTMEFSLEYLVQNAGWTPSYDIRSKDINEDIQITYKANIYQNTGYDWNNVRFTINSGDPSQSMQKPVLTPSFIDFFQNRTSNRSQGSSFTSRKTAERGVVNGIIKDKRSRDNLAGVTVSLPDLGQGTTTDINGNFRLQNIPNGNHRIQIHFVGYKSISSYINISNSGIYLTALLAEDFVSLDEVVVTGYGRNDLQAKVSGTPIVNEQEFSSAQVVTNQEISNQTNFSYKIERPYTVPSDGKEYVLQIKLETPKTNYTYAAVPKISTNAYLIGSLTEWDNLNLISGPANLYFENSYVGETYLDPISLQDSLEISLGKDERIIIERKKLKDFEERRFFGSKTRESLSYEITVRNTKSEPIEITLEDQIPVSTDESIEVSMKELSGGTLNKETGIITWNINLKPNESKSLRFNFQIEYPKGKRIAY